jgi:ribosome-binding factor A
VSFHRARFADAVRDGVAEILSRGLKDPRVGFVTVTRVELTSDQSLARVYVGILGDAAQRRRSLEGLAHSAGFVRRELGRRLRSRTLPELRFVFDAGLDNADRVAQVLEQVGVTGDAVPGAADGEDEGEPES